MGHPRIVGHDFCLGDRGVLLTVLDVRKMVSTDYITYFPICHSTSIT